MNYADLTAVELVAGFRTGDLSVEACAEALLDGVDRLASLNALRTMYKNAQNLQEPFMDRWQTLRKSIVDPPSKRLSVPQATPGSSIPIESKKYSTE